MRKLKLQMQITVDGFVAGPQGQQDWMTWDANLHPFITQLTDSSDTILMGRKMSEGFVKYWESVKPDSPEFEFAKKMVGMPKIVFSTTAKTIPGKNVRVESSLDAVNKIKNQPGNDIIVYGGASFVASLIAKKLIDELNLFVNPVAIGEGLGIFNAKAPLKLTASKAYPSGILVNSYRPA